MRSTQTNLHTVRRGVIGALIVGLSSLASAAMADPPESMAPPLGTATSIGTLDDGQTKNTAPSSVFNFADIPSGEQVALTRAVFDQGGYQLYDTEGETIVVPFTNQNLYVMKFATSPNDTMYFVNDNGTPTLYVPRYGYLENATVPGAKWYPFSERFRPATPVYLGVAPSYVEYVNTGWYPETVIYGGYYSERPYFIGSYFRPSFGFSLFIGNRPYYGWHNYHEYVVCHPAPYRVGYYNHPVYVIAARPYYGRAFRGFGPDRVVTVSGRGSRSPSFLGSARPSTGMGMTGSRDHEFTGGSAPRGSSDRSSYTARPGVATGYTVRPGVATGGGQVYGRNGGTSARTPGASVGNSPVFQGGTTTSGGTSVYQRNPSDSGGNVRVFRGGTATPGATPVYRSGSSGSGVISIPRSGAAGSWNTPVFRGGSSGSGGSVAPRPAPSTPSSAPVFRGGNGGDQGRRSDSGNSGSGRSEGRTPRSNSSEVSKSGSGGHHGRP